MALFAVLFNMAWLLVSTLLLHTIAQPLGVLMLILFLFISAKQLSSEDLYTRLNLFSDDA